MPLRFNVGQDVGANGAHEYALRVHHGERFCSCGPQCRSADTIEDRMGWTQVQRFEYRAATACEQLTRRHDAEEALGAIEDEDAAGDRTLTPAEAEQGFFYRQIGVEGEDRGVRECSG